ncbi:MAG: GNAT family N-acetyltransferase [Defluviitaleaceae bacterium]|nr:GNAT family N-acetyltransferase [Defluviitaleaceae bacterium]MCL2275871.1 GNAT family N-acetyltransferase [Defluviitaleaceae bacterium]
MDRKIYISDGEISLSEYIASEDDLAFYHCWKEDERQSAFNHKFTDSFEEWSASTSIKSRFMATIKRLSDNESIGAIFLSPEDSPPDLAIIVYKPYRGSGYGTRAFSLGTKYCFDILSLNRIYAGCYPHNVSSLKMLQKCGFTPHPEGNVNEKHYVTGEDIVQLDFVKYANLQAGPND